MEGKLRKRHPAVFCFCRIYSVITTLKILLYKSTLRNTQKSVLENDIFGYQSVFTLGNVQFSHKLNFPVYYTVKTPSRKDAFPTKTVAFIKLLLLALVAENAWKKL